uniref:Reverse transcriptase zinc-binding domain-containing protein n=1 Tax=Oreochromis niloticus TaxID=8128 RepID=A0A669CJS1_ORENI
MSRELRSRLVQFKILNRVYWTPSRLHRVGLATDDACWKCQQGSGTLLHLLWGCSKVQDYWTHIHTVVEKVVGQRVPFMNSLYVLGDPSALSHLPTPLAHWVQTAIMLGRKLLVKELVHRSGALQHFAICYTIYHPP